MLEQILNKLKGATPLTAEEKDYLFNALKSAASGKVPEGEKSEFQSYQQFNDAISAAMKEAYNSPTAKQFANEILRDKRNDVFMRRYKPLFNAILAGADVSTSISQIRNADKAIKSIVRPQAPSVPGLDPALSQSIQSINPDLEAQKALLPAEALLREQRMADMEIARQVSGGDAATYGALGNIASQRFSRGVSSLVPLGDQVRAREKARLDSLVGLRSNIAQQNFANANALYNTALNQYNTDLAAAGTLGATGRLNLRNTLGNLPQTLVGSIGSFMPVNNPYYNNLPSGNSTPTPTTYNPAFDEYGKQVTMSLARQLDRIKAQGPRPLYPRIS
jgi:hypothetical protein